MRARIPAYVLCLAPVVIVSVPSARAQADPPRATLVKILDSSITNSRGFFWSRLYARRAIYPNNWMDWSTAYCNRTPMPSGYVSNERAFAAILDTQMAAHSTSAESELQ